MAENDRRPSGNSNRKRRFREDEGDNRRNNRRRTDEGPPPIRLRRMLRGLAESPLRRWHEEVHSIGTLVANHAPDDEQLRADYLNLTLQMALEQPLKSPFLAAAALVVNARQPDIVAGLLEQATRTLEEKVAAGEWRDAKLLMKLLACMQSCLDGAGLFPLLEELFGRAVDLQTASSEDTIGTEIVKIILLTIPYIIAAAPDKWTQQAAELMDKTEIIASEPHALQAIVDPYCPPPGTESPTANMSLLRLLQAQLQTEAVNGWPLACLPRPWKLPLSDVELQSQLENAQKHVLPAVNLPAAVVSGPRPLFPEVYFSVYAHLELESVPPATHIAASLIRDAVLDTINILDFNRNASARFLIDIDCYFADETFVHRATPFDRLRDVAPGKSTWKPEDVAVDAVFSQIFALPVPEHKVVYYHSVLTEACKIAPAAIAPSLGRAIRYAYRHTDIMDLELSSRFIDWFSHHTSNFGFMWKWTEWAEDAELPDLNPRKAFIVGALDREVRLSFAQRIRKTVPDAFQPLLGPEKDKDTPDFKFDDEAAPFSAEGKEIVALLKRKAPDEELQLVIENIHAKATDHGLDPLVASTDVFMTCLCAVGSKSLSHVLACIDRAKTRLADAASASEPARAQIISAVFTYWRAHPGIALTIIEKLLNYAIITPLSVAEWAVNGPGSDGGAALARSHVFEMVFNTISKVTRRVRQVVADPAVDADTRAADISSMRLLFRTLEDALVSWASGSKDEMIEDGDGTTEDEQLLGRWGARWLRVVRRRAAVEEAFLLEEDKKAESSGATEDVGMTVGEETP